MEDKKTNNNIFVKLEDLLRFEALNSVLNFKVGKQKSNSVLAGRFASRQRGRGLDFEESRPYVIGDDIRNIDWKVTAKTGDTHTKVFTEEKEKPAFIFVDQSPTMGFGSTHKTKAKVAAELAAIAAYKIKKAGDRIGGLVFKGKEYDLITPKRDPRTILNFFQKIVDANAKIYNQETYDFGKTLQDITSKLQQIITHDYLVIIISDFHRYHKDMIQYLSGLSEHNDVILLKIVDPLEETLLKEKLTLSNQKYQIQVNGKDKNLHQKLEEDFSNNYKKFKSQVEKYNIPVFKINTVESVEEQLLALFSTYKAK